MPTCNGHPQWPPGMATRNGHPEWPPAMATRFGHPQWPGQCTGLRPLLAASATRNGLQMNSPQDSFQTQKAKMIHKMFLGHFLAKKLSIKTDENTFSDLSTFHNNGHFTLT